jgi:hypothetical protein
VCFWYCCLFVSPFCTFLVWSLQYGTQDSTKVCMEVPCDWRGPSSQEWSIPL